MMVLTQITFEALPSGEVRRAEADAMRLREEAKRLQEQLKRKAQMAGEELLR